jgi:Rieske Fe-S protein
LANRTISIIRRPAISTCWSSSASQPAAASARKADVVAFSTRCTHLGGPLRGALQAEIQVLGPCPRHLTTFDLSRHGVVITGHATASLPQVVLELDGDSIRAVGMQGLVYPDRSRHA